MTITKNVLKFYDISLDKQTQFGTISQTLTKIIFYFIIQSFLLIRAVSEFGVFSHFILWLLFFMPIAR